MACLLGCVYNTGDEPPGQKGLRQCEKACNDQFMSIKPVDKRWINEMKLYSRSIVEGDYLSTNSLDQKSDNNQQSTTHGG